MKKVLKICGVLLVCAILIAGVICMIVLPVSFKVDKSLIKKNPDYNVYIELRDGYKTVVKKDISGKILNEGFKIIAFTDTHLDGNKEKGNYTLEYIIRNVVNEKPDLVIFVGDNITGGLNGRRTRQLARTMEKLGVYWDFVLGNHEGDNIWSISRKKMVKVFSSYEHCLAEPDIKHTSDGEEVWGYGNHVINLAGTDGVFRSLFFLDGGDEMTEEDKIKYDAEYDDKSCNRYDYIKPSQIKWYEETAADIMKKTGSSKLIASAVFDHIALPEYRIAYEELTGETEVTQNVPVYDVKNENGNFMIMGQRRETICCSGHNSGFFDSILKTGSTDLVVCGHDHVNDFVLNYKGIILAYNVPSGYSSYNLYTKKLSDTLIRGYSRYTFLPEGGFVLDQLHNSALYPDAQEEIKKLYQ